MEKYKLYFCGVEVNARELEKSGFNFDKYIWDCMFDPVHDTMLFDTLEQARDYMDNCKCALIELYNHSIRYYLINYLQIKQISYNDEGDEIACENVDIKFPEKPQEEESED